MTRASRSQRSPQQPIPPHSRPRRSPSLLPSSHRLLRSGGRPTPARAAGPWLLAAGLLLLAAGLLSPVPARADAPAWEPVLATPEARDAWGFLESEAVTLLDPAGLGPDPVRYRREQIRAYVFARLLQIVQLGRSWTDQEAAAMDHLEDLILAQRRATAHNALLFYDVRNLYDLGCPGDSIFLAGPLYAYVGLPCAFTKMFGNTPTVGAFTGAGWTETFRTASDFGPGRVAADTINALTLWLNLKISPTASPEEGEILREFADFLEGFTLRGAFPQQGIMDMLLTAIMPLVGQSISSLDWAGIAMGVAVITAYGIANATISENVRAELATNLSEANANLAVASTLPPGSVVDFRVLLQGENVVELLFAVLSETMPNIPDPADCAFDSRAQGCLHFASFPQDPDFVSARYPEPTPPTHDPRWDPVFDVRCHDRFCVHGEGEVSELANLMSWTISDSAGDRKLFDRESARGLDPTSVPDTTPLPFLIYYGFSSYIANRAIVTRLVRPGGHPVAVDDSTWIYRQGIRYVDWDGNWVNAWYRPETGDFYHVRFADRVPGAFVPGDKYRGYGFTGCVWNGGPVVIGGGSSTKSLGPDCLFAEIDPRPDVTGLRPGDTLLLLGQQRVVDKADFCYHEDLHIFGADHTVCNPQNNGPAGSFNTGETHHFAKDAVWLKPGVSESFRVFDGFEILALFLGFDGGGFLGFGPRDARVMKLTNEAHGFASSAIEYKDVQGSLYRAELVPRVIGTTTLNDRVYYADIDSLSVLRFSYAGQGVSESDFRVVIDWGDGTSSDGTVEPEGACTGCRRMPFEALASHRYAGPGDYHVVVALYDAAETRLLLETSGELRVVPNPVPSNPPAYRVFVSSTGLFPILSGSTEVERLESADAFCAARAQAANLDNTTRWKAWLSTFGVYARDRLQPALTRDHQYVRLDGTVVAANWAELTSGLLAAPIAVDEFGELTTHDGECPVVWTGTETSGLPVPFGTCEDWTTNSPSANGAVGYACETNREWTHIFVPFFPCGPYIDNPSVYCFETQATYNYPYPPP